MENSVFGYDMRSFLIPSSFHTAPGALKFWIEAFFICLIELHINYLGKKFCRYLMYSKTAKTFRLNQKIPLNVSSKIDNEPRLDLLT